MASGESPSSAQDRLNEPRPIDTSAHVHSVLDSPQASFLELMDCVEAAHRLGEWELRHRAAERAFATATEGHREKPEKVEEAALEVLRSMVRMANGLDELADSVDVAKTWLAGWVTQVPRLEAFRAKELQSLDEMLVLLSDDRLPSLVRLSPKLRKLDRADLAVVAARRAVKQEPDNVVALTTLGAGLADIQEHHEARQVLETALRLGPDDSYTVIALSRVVQELGDLHEALALAKRGLELDASEPAAYRLVAAAVAMNDDEAIADAKQRIEEHVDAPEHADLWVMALAAEALLDAGRVDDARALFNRLRVNASRGEMARQMANLKRRLNNAAAAAQTKLFDP